MKKKINYILTFFGLILFAYILLNVNIQYLIEILSNIDYRYLLIVIFIYFISLFFRILKWKWITNIIVPKFTLKDATVSYLAGFAFSTITPAKIGDILRIFYVKEKNTEYGDAFSALVMDRIIDILMLLVIGIFALISFTQIFRIQVVPLEIVVSTIFLFLILTIIVMSRKSLKIFLIPIYNHLVPDKWKETALVQFIHYFDSLNRLAATPRKMFYAITAGLISWILPFFYAYFLALSIGVNLPLMFFVVVIPIIAIIELLPLSISGIGTRDLAVIFFFGLYNIPSEASVAFSILYLFICYWMLGIIGVIIWFRYPINIEM